MYYKICLFISMCNVLNCSESKRENIDLQEIHHNYNEQHREHLPGHLIHHASSSIVTERLDRGVIDLPGVPRVISEDSPDKTTVNVATTVDVKARCCNSNCCDDDKVFCDCC